MSKAIIYVGFLRTWEQVRANHKENLWEKGDALYFYTHEKPKCDFQHTYLQMEENLKEFSPAILTNHAPETQGGYILNALNQWRNRKTAFYKVAEQTQRPVIYVIARTDILFSGKINFSGVHSENIYIPKGNDYREGINDQFAFGNYDAIKQYCGLYDNWKKFFNEGLQFHPETYLKRQLEGLNILRISQTNTICR